MKTLSQLYAREIIFTFPDGQRVSVAPLAVRFFEPYMDILEMVERDLSSGTLTDGRIRLRDLICNVWPQKAVKTLYCFDYVGLCNIARVLFFGESHAGITLKTGSDESEKNDKKTLDLALMAGRILHTFPSFTLDNLLDMPFCIFMSLNTLAGRIQADNALNIYIPAVAAGLGTEGIIKSLIAQRDQNLVKSEQISHKYSDEDLQKAIAKLTGEKKEIRTIRAGRFIA